MRASPLAAVPFLLAMMLPGTAISADFSAASVYRTAAPGVVLVMGINGARTQVGTGAGSNLMPQGLVLTNHHVVIEAQTGKAYPDLKIYMKPARLTGDNSEDLQQWLPVEVVAADEQLDLAILRVTKAGVNLPVVAIGDSEEIDIGESVAAIGHPGGGGLWTLTTGTVSAKRKSGARGVFQTDTAINPGNSGGPLLDRDAHIIGVNTYINRVAADGLPLEGLNYSVRSSDALKWMKARGYPVLATRREDVASPAAVAKAEPPVRAAPAAVSEPPARAQPERRAEPANPPQVAAKPVAEPVVAPATEAVAPVRQPAQPKAPAPVVAAPPVIASRPQAQQAAPPSFGTEGPREFRGANGEKMYGVPNLKHDTKRFNKDMLERLGREADDAFKEMDKRLKAR